MEITRNDDGKIVARHWTMDDAEKEAARRRAETLDKMIRSKLAPKKIGALAALLLAAGALIARVRPRAARPMGERL